MTQLFYSSIEKFDIINFFEFYFYIFDFSVTNVLLYIFFTLLIIYLSFSTSRNLFHSFNSFFIYKFLQMIEETFFIFVFDILNKQVGKKGFVYFSFVLSIF
jgi:hypothetical protein